MHRFHSIMTPSARMSFSTAVPDCRCACGIGKESTPKNHHRISNEGGVADLKGKRSASIHMTTGGICCEPQLFKDHGKHWGRSQPPTEC